MNSRIAPRYTVNAPVKVQAEEGPTARLEYANPEEFADDYVENLSQGGAFVRTQRGACPRERGSPSTCGCPAAPSSAPRPR